MDLTFKKYREKVLGCWNGKNCGGTLGGPYEGKRGVLNATGYNQDIQGKPLPNDDLDLQLVWLEAAEKYGKNINSSILAEYWLSYIIPDWSEYGQGKANLRAGFQPPLSGYISNPYRDSNGAWILTEIWACLNPGFPKRAAEYAFEDASVNHSAEGVYSAVFCAAVESAAFVESDTRKLIDIGLSYIPEDCGVAKGIKCVIDCYDNGLTWQEARKKLLQEVPGSFGSLATLSEEFLPDEPLGERGYDAPSNIGIIIIGWLYGEGDFGESLCIANNCGEDTDCTAGTLGAILGIIHGSEYMGEKWLAPLGGNIETLCIDKTKCFTIPKTIDELTDRVIRLAPTFIDTQSCVFTDDEPGYKIIINENALMCSYRRIGPWNRVYFKELLDESPYTIRKKSPLFDVRATYLNGWTVKKETAFSINVNIANKWFYQQWVELKWHLPAGIEAVNGSKKQITVDQCCNLPGRDIEFTFVANEVNDSRYELVLEVSALDHPTRVFIPMLFLAE